MGTERIKFSIEMTKINKLVTAYINDGLDEYNVTRSEIPFLLTLLKTEGVTQEYLSRIYDLNEGTVTRALARLEKKELVERVPNPKDRRKKMVLLTEKGKDISLAISEKQKVFEKEIFSNFSEEEYDQFAFLFRKLMESLREKFI